MIAFRHFVLNNFSLILILGIFAGLFMPGFEYAPKSSAIGFVVAIMFFSCAKISLEELKHIDIKQALIFYIGRFVILPVLMYWVALQIVPDYAIGVLLLALMPVGVSATATAIIVKGNPSFALSATVLTTLAAPFAVPVIIGLVAGESVTFDLKQLFITLLLTVFVPAGLYFGVARNIKPVRQWIEKETQFYSILLLGLMVAAMIGAQRPLFFEKVDAVLLSSFIGFVMYFVFFIVGWFYNPKMNIAERKTYSLSSGLNNSGLAIGLSALYFQPLIILFCVVIEIPWCIAAAIFNKIAERIKEDK